MPSKQFWQATENLSGQIFSVSVVTGTFYGCLLLGVLRDAGGAGTA
jgi:hypothetical protein